MAWYTEGEQASPADGTLLASTGKLLTGNNVAVTVVVSSAVAAVVVVQYRDAAGTNTKRDQVLRLVANSTLVVPLGVHPLEPSEGIQVVTKGATLGAVQASVMY